MAVITGNTVLDGTVARSARRATIYEYDFAVSGGAIGTLPLVPVYGSTIPTGAIVDSAMVEILTIPTSGGAATAAVTIEAANDVVNAAAISGAPWSSLGRKAGIPISAATSLKTTAARTPSLVIAAFALTAGKFRLYVTFF